MSLAYAPPSDMASASRALPVIAIRRAGALARAACLSGAEATVAGVFASSFYLRARERFICVGEERVGNGPLTLIVDDGACIGSLGLQIGMPATVSADAIRINEAVEFGLEGCTLWWAPRWPTAATLFRLLETCQAIAERSTIEAPAEGLARLTIAGICSATAFEGAAAVAIARFQSWLDDALAEGNAPSSIAPVSKLLGLGPGLTPAGDDFLSGALAMLDALGERRIHAALAGAVGDAAPALTSPLSACLLDATAAGQVGERLHDLAAALVTGDVADAIDAANAIGHSSGWDMLSGAISVMRAVATYQKARPAGAIAGCD